MAFDTTEVNRTSVFLGIGLEALLAFLLVFAIFALFFDPRFRRTAGESVHRLNYLWLGLFVAAVTLASSGMMGTSLNPARWFGTVIWESTVAGLDSRRPWADPVRFGSVRFSAPCSPECFTPISLFPPTIERDRPKPGCRRNIRMKPLTLDDLTPLEDMRPGAPSSSMPTCTIETIIAVCGLGQSSRSSLKIDKRCGFACRNSSASCPDCGSGASGVAPGLVQSRLAEARSLAGRLDSGRRRTFLAQNCRGMRFGWQSMQ